MKTLYSLVASVFLTALASDALAETDLEWDELVVEALKLPHKYSVKCSQAQASREKVCVHMVEVRAQEGHRHVLQRTLGPNIDMRIMCLDGKCVPAN